MTAGLGLAKSCYRRVTAAVGLRVFEQRVRPWVPDSLHDAIRFLFTKELDGESRAVVARVEALRAAVASRGGEPADALASPAPRTAAEGRSSPGPLTAVTLARVASVTSIPDYWGAFLFLCARGERARTILELGSCAGISGSYLAQAPSCDRFVTVEGSKDLATLARENIEQVAPGARVVNALFDDALDELLPGLDLGLDLVYLDGQHEKLATLHYVDRIAPHCNRGCVLVFDDIHWTSDMDEAWDALRARAGFSHAVDLGRFGVAIWDPGSAGPACFDLSRFTDLWRPGKPRD